MTALAQHARGRSATRARGARAPRQRAGRSWLAGGVVWIVSVAVLLAGVVAINVAVLRLNLDLDAANRHRAELKADIAATASKLASKQATETIVTNAQQAGLAPADPATTVHVDISP